MIFRQLFDSVSGTYTYLIASRHGGEALILGPNINVPMLLVHVSAKEAMHEIQRAQARGLKVYGETCPQYLFLSEEDFDKPGDDAEEVTVLGARRSPDQRLVARVELLDADIRFDDLRT